MKLWDKGTPVDEMMEMFTVGRDREVDVRLARWDVVGSIAHANMLGSVGLVSEQERLALTAVLSDLLESIDINGFVIEPDVEDVHTQVEKILTEKLGDVGKKIHTGRSRNDQVLVDIKLFLRHELRTVKSMVRDSAIMFCDSAERYLNVPLPGYTHYQIAMPSSFGLWFGGYAEALIEDMRVLDMAIDAANANPLGSAAGYGTRLPINREFTTRALNFDRVHVTSTFAAMSRGRTEKLAAIAVAQLASTLGRFASDVVHYASQNFDFVRLPDSFVTGSSIMPHKRNPDIFEVLRARCNRLQSLPIEIGIMMANLPSGYHRDLQFVKDRIIPAMDEVALIMGVLLHVVPHIEPLTDILSDPKYNNLFSVDRVDQLVLGGMPFRDAYHQVARELEESRAEGGSQASHPAYTTPATGALGSPGNVGIKELRKRLGA